LYSVAKLHILTTVAEGASVSRAVDNPSYSSGESVVNQVPSSSIAFLASWQWWRCAIRAALVFAPSCLPPAFGLSCANVSMLLGMHVIYAAINQPQPEIDQLGKAAAIGLACSAAGLVLICWAVTVWLFRLTAFARAWLTADRPGKQDVRDSIAETRKRTGYLAKLWLVASFYLLMPVLLLCVLMGLKIVTSPEYVGHSAFQLKLPLWADYAASAGLAALVFFATAYSLLAIVVSSVSSMPARQAAQEALLLFCRTWAATLVVTLVMFLINCVIATPQALLSVTRFVNVPRTPLAVDIGLQVWLALTSSVLWPLSVAPYCELLRGKVK
jgi:hypothetical protein